MKKLLTTFLICLTCSWLIYGQDSKVNDEYSISTNYGYIEFENEIYRATTCERNYSNTYFSITTKSSDTYLIVDRNNSILIDTFKTSYHFTKTGPFLGLTENSL